MRLRTLVGACRRRASVSRRARPGCVYGRSGYQGMMTGLVGAEWERVAATGAVRGPVQGVRAQHTHQV